MSHFKDARFVVFAAVLLFVACGSSGGRSDGGAGNGGASAGSGGGAGAGGAAGGGSGTGGGGASGSGGSTGGASGSGGSTGGASGSGGSTGGASADGGLAACTEGAPCALGPQCVQLCFASGVSGTQGCQCSQSKGTYHCSGPCLPN